MPLDSWGFADREEGDPPGRPPHLDPHANNGSPPPPEPERPYVRKDSVPIKISADIALALKRNAGYLGIHPYQMLRMVVMWAIRTGAADKQVKVHLKMFKRYVRFARVRLTKVGCQRRVSTRMLKWAKKYGCTSRTRAWRACIVRACWEAWRLRFPELVRKEYRE